MNQPQWKIGLSYLKDVHLESASSIHNDHLEVLLVKGEYQLVTPEAIYSYGKRYDNYFEAFKQLDIENLPINDVLVLGLGLGSIPYMLENYFNKDCVYTAIEIDDVIIYLASKYVLNDLTSDITTIHTDAAHFMNVNNEKFDLIASDIFLSDFVPEEFEQEGYLVDLKNALNDGGLVMYNRLYLYDKDKENTERYFNEVFQKVFPNAHFIEVSGNRILVGKK